eukprot:CAMPEP_0176501488 /NCGR_PEP_ID=MMETSP0200_2-20121128/14185_1 /TAXON_ID=947934 /ORGANISM="Chaetoceros sp., Strain GSL56" /LENGTH=306 /DNA_ID=CAMNT_0017900373 /DNA_START=131 /DNA_END=1048 /DNA_ORIENTATION=+
MAQSNRPRTAESTTSSRERNVPRVKVSMLKTKIAVRKEAPPREDGGGNDSARTTDMSDNTCHLSYGSANNNSFNHEIKKGQDSQELSSSFPGTEIVLVMSDIMSNEEKDAEEREYIIRLLSRRAMHLPNMNWWQDWLQFMKNNHLILGIFFHHKLHPLKVPHRFYMLLASIAFGLAATNCVYLYHVFHDDEMNKILVQIALDESPLNFEKLEALEVTYGMVVLWTFGGALHSIFDIAMWYLSACACFLSGASCSNRGKYQVIGSYIVIALTAVLVGLALFVVLMRAAYDRRLRLAEEGIMLKEFEW